MKIGYYFEASSKSGGAYQYGLNIIEALKKLGGHEFIVFNISPDFPYHLVNLPNWKVIDVIQIAKKSEDVKVTATVNIAKDTSFRRRFNLFVLESLRKIHLYKIENFLTSMNARRRAKLFEGHNLDLMFYHGPSELSFLTKIPGVVPIHDIEHRLHKGEFPELSEKGQYAKREYLFKNIAKKSWRILVDSKVSEEDVAREYSVKDNKIRIVPFVPPIYLRTDLTDAEKKSAINKFRLPKKFIYYPASLWPHKNHIGLLKAVDLLKKQGLRVDLALTGNLSDQWGELTRLKKFIADNKLIDQIHFLGFVNADEISVLYKTAEAMVMPVLMGPTYIPVYEAWHMGCPVIYSNIRGPREQAGDAALLVDPKNPQDIADKVRTLWGNDALRKNLADKGKKRLTNWTWLDFCNSIESIICEFDERNNTDKRDKR